MVRKYHLLNVLVAILLVVGLLAPSTATALSSTTIKLWIGNASMSVNGVQQPIDAQGTKPVIVEGRTLVPIRAVIEALGGSVAWDATESKVTVTLGKDSLNLWIGKSTASLDGSIIPVDSANPKVVPLVINGRTFLPLRFVAESLGISIQYDAAQQMIILAYSIKEIITPPVVTVNWCEIGREYVAPGGLTVTVNSIVRVEQPGSVQYTVSYRLKNNTMDKKLDEGTFKLFLRGGEGMNQYGFFNALFPQGSLDRSYAFEIMKNQTPYCLEFNDQDGAFFRGTPAQDTLKWQVNP